MILMHLRSAHVDTFCFFNSNLLTDDCVEISNEKLIIGATSVSIIYSGVFDHFFFQLPCIKSTILHVTAAFEWTAW